MCLDVSRSHRRWQATSPPIAQSLNSYLLNSYLPSLALACQRSRCFITMTSRCLQLQESENQSQVGGDYPWAHPQLFAKVQQQFMATKDLSSLQGSEPCRPGSGCGCPAALTSSGPCFGAVSTPVQMCGSPRECANSDTLRGQGLQPLQMQPRGHEAPQRLAVWKGVEPLQGHFICPS